MRNCLQFNVIRKYVGPVQTCYAAVHEELHDANPDNWPFELKTGTRSLVPKSTFTPVLVFSAFFVLS